MLNFPYEDEPNQAAMMRLQDQFTLDKNNMGRGLLSSDEEHADYNSGPHRIADEFDD